MFNILSNAELRLNETLNFDLMSDVEISTIQNSNFFFMVNRASLSLQRLNIFGLLDRGSTTVEAIRSTYNDQHTFTLIDMFFQMNGYVLMNEDLGTNLYIENIELDLFATIEAVKIGDSCNFPDAILDHTVEIKNMLLYNSEERLNRLFTSIQILGSPNITITNSTVLIYGSELYDVGPIEVTSTSD